MTKPADRALFDELMEMKKRMDSLYAERFTERAPTASCNEASCTWQPAADVYETETHWIATVDLPGVVDEDLEVKVEQSRLTVEGKRQSLAGLPAEVMANCCERPMGKFRRVLDLPEELSIDQVNAELIRGVLTVQIAKKTQAARKIIVRPD